MYEQQDLTWRRIHRIAELKRRFVEEPLADSAAGECLYYYDLSLIVRIGAHFGLWGGSVRNLGTERHHRELLPDILSLKLPGARSAHCCSVPAPPNRPPPVCARTQAASH